MATLINLNRDDIIAALKQISLNTIAKKYCRTNYDLLYENKKYPPKYVIAFALNIKYNDPISVKEFNSQEARLFLQSKGFTVEPRGKNLSNREKYELTITKDKITSTDTHFTLDDLHSGDAYEPIDVNFIASDGKVIKRELSKYEKEISCQTLPRLAFQIFEKQINLLSSKEKNNFPICQYSPDEKIYRGIFSTENDFHKSNGATIEFLKYRKTDGKCFYIYCWNIFSTIKFIKECLNRFGDSKTSFVLTYCNKEGLDRDIELNISSSSLMQEDDLSISDKFIVYKNNFSNVLKKSKNIIFHGAPGTGKSYLAKAIAIDIVSKGQKENYDSLSSEEKQQIGFVQFHPSYDYSDFVEGLRPITDNGTMVFELQDGIFKKFIDKVRTSEKSSKPSLGAPLSHIEERIRDFVDQAIANDQTFATTTHNTFRITGITKEKLNLEIPKNKKTNTIDLKLSELKDLLQTEKDFKHVKDITDFFGKNSATQAYSYEFILYQEISRHTQSSAKTIKKNAKDYVFIIDEINRGDISKIFGELFFAIDPGYRGPTGSILTQYAASHDDPDEKFYIPENVYIIGTMNDIDRSVDSFDFAMRRRFRFIELKANKHTDMLDILGNKKQEAINRMRSLNEAIAQTDGLNENYQIGAAYFLKLKDLDYDYAALWDDFLQPLLLDYVRGMHDESSIMQAFRKAYDMPQAPHDNTEVEAAE